MTATLPRSRPASTKPVTWTYWPCVPGRGTIEIYRGDKRATYDVREVGRDDDHVEGRYFRLFKSGSGKQIDCFIADDPEYSRCDCEDAVYGQDRVCKHIISMTAIVRSGEIDLEDPDYPAEEPCSPTAPDRPAQEAVPASGGPSVAILVPCPICGDIATARPVADKTYNHSLHCPSCVQRAETVFDGWYAE